MLPMILSCRLRTAAMGSRSSTPICDALRQSISAVQYSDNVCQSTCLIIIFHSGLVSVEHLQCQNQRTCLAKPPTTVTFSFTAPFPAVSSSISSTSSTSSTLKQRHASLALPSFPRLVPAWNFRDDAGLVLHVAEISAPMPERKGKMCKMAGNGDYHKSVGAFIIQQKKPRKKWSKEET
ncbi:uncharacterized protein EDB93DRAFT_805592 [Suillus bovinus]|uniref:uncharacterized protein n=1 Tax=Suillus bovinus TaxID=48563 RepID=UPI001B860AE8|nr:uncharacterized protein EDB93DRAFT_805592 [Suillus bovinus]KAG2157673.1 hypothetical protein EDB93DRAFT_805592 [Suillus bovinus]